MHLSISFKLSFWDTKTHYNILLWSFIVSEGPVVILVSYAFTSLFFFSVLNQPHQQLISFIVFVKRLIFGGFHCSFLLHVCYYFYSFLLPILLLTFLHSYRIFLLLFFQLLSWILSLLICSLYSFLTHLFQVIL